MKKKRGIIERLVMGKPKDSDFTERDLPSTRFKQFKFVFKTRFGIIFRANLLSALFFLPFMVFDVIVGSYAADFVKGMTAEQHFSHLINLTLLQYASEIPLIIFGFAGLAGLFYVLRRICWGQSVKIIADFGKGLKQSWLQFALLGLVTGIINLLAHYIINFAILTISGGNVILWSLAIALTAVFVIIWCVALMFAFCQSSLYKLSFFRLILNSYIFTFKRLFRSLLFCFCSLAPILIFAFMPWAFMKIIGCCVAIVFSFGFAATVQTVYCHGVFDVFINSKDYPDFVGMGLAGAKIFEEIREETVAEDEPSEAVADGAAVQNVTDVPDGADGEKQ